MIQYQIIVLINNYTKLFVKITTKIYMYKMYYSMIFMYGYNNNYILINILKFNLDNSIRLKFLLLYS